MITSIHSNSTSCPIYIKIFTLGLSSKLPDSWVSFFSILNYLLNSILFFDIFFGAAYV